MARVINATKLDSMMMRLLNQAVNALKAGDEVAFRKACSGLLVGSETKKEVMDDIRLAFTDIDAWYAKRGYGRPGAGR